MSTDTLREILDELGRADEVAVAERLKASACDLAALLADLPGDDGALNRERVADLLDASSEACESFLTVALPTVEYAEHAAFTQLPQAVRHITRATAAANTEQTARRVAAVPAVGRVVWALTAYALHCDRPGAIGTLASARVEIPFRDEFVPVPALISLRYPDALEGNAGHAFDTYLQWLVGLQLLERYPLFGSDIEAALLEADLVLAMFAAQYYAGGEIYSRGHDKHTVRRFAARVEDERQREPLTELFRGEGTLEDRLERAYSAVHGDRRRFDTGPATLFQR